MSLTVPEAARRTGRNPETIRRWIREGKLRAHKVGTQHVIEEDDLADATRGAAGRPVLTPDADRMESHQSYPAALHQGRPDWARQLREVGAPYLAGAPGHPAVTTDRWLATIVGRIVRLVDPARIVLFGSRGRGDAWEGSDYDLLVIVDQVASRRAMGIAIRRSFEDLPVAADVVVATAEEADGSMPGRPAGVVYWALRDGRVVYDRGNVA